MTIIFTIALSICFLFVIWGFLTQDRRFDNIRTMTIVTSEIWAILIMVIVFHWYFIAMITCFAFFILDVLKYEYPYKKIPMQDIIIYFIGWIIAIPFFYFVSLLLYKFI